MTVGERIRDARKSMGLTQAQLADQSGVAAISIHQYETGKRNPRIEQLLRIAEALDITVTDLMSEQDTQIFMSGFNTALDGLDIMPQVDNFRKKLWGYRYTKLERALIKDFSLLNPDGQQKAVERIEELTEIPRYRAETASESPPPPQEGESTTPPPDGPGTASEGE